MKYTLFIGSTAFFQKTIRLTSGTKGETKSTVANYFGHLLFFYLFWSELKEERNYFSNVCSPIVIENNFKNVNIMPIKKKLDRFLKTGLAEGLSFIILLTIAMPLKYMANMALPVRIVGMLHGVLFILYTLYLLQAAIAYKWTISKTAAAFLLSFVPLGTFFLESLLRKEIKAIKLSGSTE
jgi:integral membrane protein